MKWMKFKVRTTAAAEDILISSMQDLGLSGAQIEDHVPLTAAEKEQMFVDIMPDEPENDGSAVLSFFVEEQNNGELLLEEDGEIGPAAESGGSLQSVTHRAGRTVTPEQLKSAMEAKITQLKQFCDFIGDGTVTIEETQDADWMNNWKQYFHQFMIDDILIIPSWEQPEEGEQKPALTFHIDPGTAFGTGLHETTQLCIRQIRKYVTPDTKILDIGTGSGILAILALMFGAQSAVGTDLDPCAAPAIEENLARNGVPRERMRVIAGNLSDDTKVQAEVGFEEYDIVAANILPDVLVPLTPAAAAALKAGGVYITSGIVEGRETEVMKAMQDSGLTDISVFSQGEWKCVTGRKPKQ